MPTKKQSNNNKGESGIGFRRGKSNSESKVQAARNKHKNCQNKEKHNVRGSSQSDTTNHANAQLSMQNKTQSQVNGQKDVRNCSVDSIIETEQQKSAIKQKIDNAQSHRILDSELKLKQQFNDLKINGVVQNVDYSHLERDGESQCERGTPTSTISSSDDSNAIHQIELLAKLKEDNDHSTLLGIYFYFIHKFLFPFTFIIVFINYAYFIFLLISFVLFFLLTIFILFFIDYFYFIFY